jgi:hypothetical protein
VAKPVFNRTFQDRQSYYRKALPTGLAGYLVLGSFAWRLNDHGRPPPPIAREVFQGTNVSALLIALQGKEGFMANYISN